MRIAVVVLLGLAGAVGLGADEPDRSSGGSRYGTAPDLKAYPQATPKEALASVLKAIDAKRFDYLLAQLADPDFVEDRVRRLYGGDFRRQVDDTRARLDPGTVKQLRRFLTEGEWTAADGRACVSLKDVGDRCVRLRRLNGRWYLEHRDDPPRGK